MHSVQRAPDDLGIDFGGQRLTHARWSCAQHRGTAGFASHDVVHQHVHFRSEDVDEIDLFLGQDQFVF